VARWEGELDEAKLARALAGTADDSLPADLVPAE